MRIVNAISWLTIVVGAAATARPAMAQTPMELPAPYIQQVPPQLPPPSIVPEGRIYGSGEAQPGDGGVAEPTVVPGEQAVEELQLPPEYQMPEAPAAASDYGGEYDPSYDMSQDNAVAQSYDDGYDPQAAAQFQDGLAPYGTWIDDAGYGRVWQPSAAIVGAGFFPYATGGHWALTEFGWTWVSDWDWGWAPFHYGRWTVLAQRGWCWIPGTLWGPAWVGWRAGGGYVGWTPLPPRGLWVGQPGGRGSRWRFTTAGMMGSPRPTYVSSRAVPTVFGRTTVVSNARTMAVGGSAVAVNAGPTRVPSNGPMGSLAEIAPRALPRIAVQPRVSAPFASRPWVRAGMAAAPPTVGRPVSHTGAPFGAAVPSFRAPPPTYGGMGRPGGFGGVMAPAGRGLGPRSGLAPLPRPPAARSTFAPAPARGLAPMPVYAPTHVVPRTTFTNVGPRFSAPAGVGPRFVSPAPATTFAPAPRTFAPPARTFTPAPAPHFSAPRSFSPAPAPHFSVPRSSGFGHGPSFGGGRRR